MDSTRKKRLIAPLVLLIAGLFLFNFVIFDGGNQEEEILSVPDNPEEKVIANEDKAMEDSVTQYAASLNFPEDFSSPFALLNDFTNQAKGGATPSEIPLIPQLPDNMPDFPTNFELPDMPGTLGIASASVRDVFLKAVLYKPGRPANMAILDDGTNETIVVEGKNSPWGYVSKITASSVILDNRTLTLEM